MAGRRGYRMTNGLASPVLRRVLRWPPGRSLGRSLAVVRYTGRRTGAPHELVCRYVPDGDRIWILVGQAEHETWWLSLRTPAPVGLWPAGRHVRATAVAVVGAEEPEECASGLAAYSGAGPGVVATPVPEVVMVRADPQHV